MYSIYHHQQQKITLSHEGRSCSDCHRRYGIRICTRYGTGGTKYVGISKAILSKNHRSSSVCCALFDSSSSLAGSGILEASYHYYHASATNLVDEREPVGWSGGTWGSETAKTKNTNRLGKQVYVCPRQSSNRSAGKCASQMVSNSVLMRWMDCPRAVSYGSYW